jgi:predicted aminopeptidase
MKFSLSWFYLPVFITPAFLLGLSFFFSGCYTLKQGTTMLSYLNRAIPLEELGNAVSDSEDDRLFVKKVEDIRRFALEELGLKKSKNYTRYVELDRNYLAAVVSASPKDSFGRYEWWFPVVGKVPYKGFFNVEDARKERAKLEKKDLDIWIRGVDAFSTLGWFRDPLYSYMKKYSDLALAELIIHELLHATVYIKNHAQFNEELAEFVGTEGGRLYKEKTIRAENSWIDEMPAESESAPAEADMTAYLGFIRSLIAELDALYKSGMPREDILKRKEEIIGEAKLRFDTHYDTLFQTDNYRFFSKLPVNNAYLELYRLYHEGDHYFMGLYEKSEHDLRQFIAAAKTLSQKQGQKNPREAFEKALGLK